MGDSYREELKRNSKRIKASVRASGSSHKSRAGVRARLFANKAAREVFNAKRRQENLGTQAEMNIDA